MTKIKLLFTCPHGGTDPTDILERVKDHLDTAICKEDEGQGFNNQNDALTKELTDNIYNNIRNLSGKEPYKEIAKFHRKYIDYNRKNECAYEQSSLEAKQAYQEYHNGILQKIEEMLPQNDASMAFLFDIHGTGREKSPEGDFIEAIIGTDERRSIEALTEVDPNAFWGPNGLIPLLEEKRIRVYPKNASQKEQGFILDGGHIIQTYGSSRIKKGLVAIQIEVIFCIRDNRYCREKFGADMADCILTFVRPFI